MLSYAGAGGQQLGDGSAYWSLSSSVSTWRGANSEGIPLGSRLRIVKFRSHHAGKPRLRQALPAGLAFALAALAALVLGMPAGRSAAAEASLQATTDKYLYHPDDTVTFNISVDAAGQNLSGDLILQVYPAASPAAANPIAGQPLTRLDVRKGYSVSGKDTLQFSAPVKKLGVAGGGYPVRISLMGPGGEQLGANAWLAVVDPAAHDPLDLVLVWSVSSPPERNPEGVFESSGLSGRCQPGGAPNSILDNGELAQKFPSLKTTYAIEPSLLDQLEAMSGGFKLNNGGKTSSYGPDSPEAGAARGCLDSLKQLAAAGNAEILASPYTFANLPLLAKNGWEDGNSEYRVGRDVESRLLGLDHEPKGAFAPGLDVTSDSLRYLAGTGGDYTVLPGSFRTAIESSPDLAGAASYRLRDLGGERITAFFADDGASAALFGDRPDPAAFFAALANDFYAGGRLAVVAPESLAVSLPDQQRDQIYATINAESWLKTITLGDASQKYRPSTEPATLLKYLDVVTGYVSQTYYQQLDSAHSLYEAYSSAVDADEPTAISLSRMMLTAESGYWAGPWARPEDANQGLPYLENITGVTGMEFSRLGISVGLPLLQGSGNGEADVSVENGNSYPLTADIVVEADGVSFPGGTDQKVLLNPGVTDLRFAYQDAGWARLKASIRSQGVVLADDSTTIHPISRSVWIVIGVAAAAFLIGLGYVLLVVRRR